MTRAVKLTPKGEDLGRRVWRIAAAALEVDRLRERKDAARKARNKIQCRNECNVSGGGRTEKPPCWKNPDVIEGLNLECDRCRKRQLRQDAYARSSRALGGARRRLTVLVRNCRREHGDVI